MVRSSQKVLKRHQGMHLKCSEPRTSNAKPSTVNRARAKISCLLGGVLLLMGSVREKSSFLFGTELGQHFVLDLFSIPGL